MEIYIEEHLDEVEDQDLIDELEKRDYIVKSDYDDFDDFDIDNLKSKFIILIFTLSNNHSMSNIYFTKIYQSNIEIVQILNIVL